VNIEMKITTTIFKVCIWGSILFFSMSCHSQTQITNTQINSTPIVTQNSPTSESSDAVPTLTNIQINPKPGEYLVDKNGNTVSVLLKSVSPIYIDPLPEGSLYSFNNVMITSKKGDLCLVLPFQVESHISKIQYLDISAQGYDTNGNLVSVCLNWGPIFGQTVIQMQPNGVKDVSLKLLPSKDLIRVEIVVYALTDIVPP
jgi:hypothetical protein